MKISVKTGIINSASFLLLSILAVIFFQISTRNIIIKSQAEDLKRTAEHFILHEEFSKLPAGKGKNAYDDKRYSLLSESIYISDLNTNDTNIIQDPFNLNENAVEGIFQYDDYIFLGIILNHNQATYLVAGDITPEYESINLFKTISILFIIITIIISLILGIITTRISMNPWKKFLHIVKNINASDLNKRFKVEGQDDEIREMEKSLNSMLERLESGFNLQKRFSSDAAHELRTPVTSIKGYAQILQKWGLEDKTVAEEAVDSIAETVAEMEDMIEKLLTMSRLESETVKLSEFDTAEWIIQLKKSLRRKYDKRHIIFENRGFNRTIRSSEKYLNILIGIFVDNAVKYSEETEPVYIIMKKNTIIIKDHGIGIPEKEIETIFERFYQVDSSRTKKEEKGFGIGLSIAKKIIHLLNINLLVKSEVTVGTEIIIEIGD
jgi:signal transduction histidine kinase